MLDALVDWENREVARVGQATGTVELLQTAQHLGAAIALGKNAVYPVWPRQVQHDSAVTIAVHLSYSIETRALRQRQEPFNRQPKGFRTRGYLGVLGVKTALTSLRFGWGCHNRENAPSGPCPAVYACH